MAPVASTAPVAAELFSSMRRSIPADARFRFIGLLPDAGLTRSEINCSIIERAFAFRLVLMSRGPESIVTSTGGMNQAHDRQDKEFMTTLAKGLTVLAAFGKQRPAMTLSEAADVAGLSRATERSG